MQSNKNGENTSLGHTGEYDTIARALVIAFREYKHDNEDMKARGLFPWAASTHWEARMITVVLLTAALCEALANTILNHAMTDPEWKKADHEPTPFKWKVLIPQKLNVLSGNLPQELATLLDKIFVLRISIVHAKPTLLGQPEGKSLNVIRQGNGKPWDKLDYDFVSEIVNVPMRLLDAVVNPQGPSVYWFIRHQIHETLVYRMNKRRSDPMENPLKVTGHFYFKQSGNGNLTGEFANNKSTSPSIENCEVIIAGASAYFGVYKSTWMEGDELRQAELTISPKLPSSGLFKAHWRGTTSFKGEGMILGDALIGNYRQL